jgi:hypothetical protein
MTSKNIGNCACNKYPEEKVINNVGKNGKKWSKVGINSIFLPSK